MLLKIPKATAVVSFLLATITIALTLTLTVSAARAEETVTRVESTATDKIIPTTAKTTRRTHAETTAGISERSKVSNGTVTTITETTTTTFLKLQPPSFNVANRTTATDDYQTEMVPKESEPETKNSINHKIKQANSVAISSDKQQRDETKGQDERIGLNAFNVTGTGQQIISNSNSENVFLGIKGQSFRLPSENDKDQQESTMNNPKPGYIEFEHRNSEDLATKRKQKRTETVNEVLSSLFPNGFSDIFRFSYASEQQKSSEVPPQGTRTESPLTKPLSTATSNSPTLSIITTTPTTARIIEKPSFSYTASVSKEYRRLVRPGHEEIVVEKLASPVSSEEFRDGSNSISKTDLLRINRAAAEASVLPSLLLNPINRNATASTNSTRKAPIIILKENSPEQYDIEDEIDDDNQIAESQDIAQHFYHRLPNTNIIPSDNQWEQPTDGQSNDEIKNDKVLRKQTQKRAFGQRLFTPASELRKATLFDKNTESTPIDPSYDQPISQQQDHYQQEAEKTFVEPSQATEAPSRQFLKHFNPQLSESTAGLVTKGNFHYELQRQQQQQQQQQPHLSATTEKPGDYENYYIQPAAQLEFQREKLKGNQHQSTEPEIQTQSSSLPFPAINTNSDYKGYGQQEQPFDESPSQNSVVFVTLNTPTSNVTPISTPVPFLSPLLPGKSPQEYVSEAVGAASQRMQQQLLSSAEPKPNAGYTFVEVQKSVNIHNKLITEKDGQLVEQHETIYHQPQYGKNFPDVSIPQPVHKDYVSLSENPINVQQIDSETDETHEEAASHHSQQTYQGVAPLPADHQVHIVEKVIPQPYPVPIEKVIDRPYPVNQIIEKQVPAPYPVQEIVEKIVDRPVPVEKIIDRPVQIPYPVHIDHYVDRPYPVHEFIETHVPVPYAVPEPVPVAVPVEHYIDRPYPVETIVEKRIPYPVEKVVEKVVEKHVPVEKIVEKVIDRPVAVPIHVPVAVPVQISHTSTGYAHPNALGWIQQEQLQAYKIPEKVLQNYYSRMLKKLFNPKLSNAENPATSRVPANSKKPAQPKTPIQFTKPPFKISDIRYDLKPPPAPLGPSWSKGARYIYKTLPKDLSTAASSNLNQKQKQTQKHTQTQEQYVALLPPDSYQMYDEQSGWRLGHLLKRSPDFGRNLHIEYGFKPPLVPSVEIDDKGIPLSVVGGKSPE